MVHFPLLTLLWTAMYGSKAEKAAALAAAIACLLTLSSLDAARQLTFRGGNGWRVLDLLAIYFSRCEQAGPFLSLIIERSRESCGTPALMNLRTVRGATSLHNFAANCSNLSLTKVVLREFPPSLTVLDNFDRTPLHLAESNRGSTSEFAVFLRAASSAFDASNFVALEALSGSSPYLSRAIQRQTIALRAAVAICLNRQEAAPSALDSVKAGVALSLLGRARDFGRVGNSSDVLRVILEYVGP